MASAMVKVANITITSVPLDLYEGFLDGNYTIKIDDDSFTQKCTNIGEQYIVNNTNFTEESHVELCHASCSGCSMLPNNCTVCAEGYRRNELTM